MTHNHTPSRRSFLSLLGIGSAAIALTGCGSSPAEAKAYRVTFSDAEWKKRLSPAAYQTLRHEATERPFSSPLLNEHRKGQFACAGCGTRVYDAKTKFDSGTGWPSFWAAIPGSVANKSDRQLIYERIEEHCATCGGHLGHVFDDGPPPTGKRHCINGVALKFIPA